MSNTGISFSFSFPEDFVKLYEEYRNDPKKLRFLELEGIAPKHMDIPLMSKEFFTKDISEISIDTNANANSKEDDTKAPILYSTELPKGMLKLEGYYLIYRSMLKKYGKEEAERALRKVWEGDLYMHDASGPMLQTYYCFAYSTSRLMSEGRPWGQLHSKVPKRSYSFLSQVIETTMDFSQQQAGAVAISDVIINYAWYAKKENLTDKEIEDSFQNFIHIINNKFRSGQSAFTNISLFDKNNLQTMFSEHTYPDFTKPDFEYISKLQEIFLRFFSKGDPMTGLPYRFPVVTVSFLNDPSNGYPLDESFLDMITEYTHSNGCVNIYVSNDVGKISSCCRLVNDYKLLKTDSFGNGGTSIGSARVVTVNLASIALQANKDENKYFDILKSNLDDARNLLLAHRELLKKRAKDGFIPFVNRNYVNIDKHLFSTFGINAISEAAYFMKDSDIHTSVDAKDFAKRVLTYIKEYSFKCIEDTGLPFNVEEVPAESLAPKHAAKDAYRYGKDKQPFPLYSNQFIPLWTNIDVFDRIKIEGEFSKTLTGGGITHINLDSPLTNKEDMKRLVRFSIKSGLEHFAINLSFNQCAEGHVSAGSNKATVCPICGEPIVDSLTRIVGYFVPISSWNKVRKEYEFEARSFTSLQE